MKVSAIWLATFFTCLCLNGQLAHGASPLQAKGNAKIGRNKHVSGQDVRAVAVSLARRASTKSRQVRAMPTGKALSPVWGSNSQGARVDWDNARANASPQWDIVRDRITDTPIFIRNRSISPAAKRAPRFAGLADEIAMDVIERHRDVFKLTEPRVELELTETFRDKLGHEHVHFQQQYRGLPIWGNEVVVHLDAGGFMSSINGRYNPTAGFTLSTEPVITADEAVQRVNDHLAQRVPILPITGRFAELMNYDGPLVDLQVVIDDLAPRLTWKVEVRSNWRDRWVYFLDAQTGEIFDHYNSTPSEGPAEAQAVDLNDEQQTLQVYEIDDAFIMVDGTRHIFKPEQPDVVWDPRGALWTLTQDFVDLGDDYLLQVVSSDNTWDDPVAVSAHANMGRVFDYFFEVHGRDGIDGEGGTMISIIHATDGGVSMENAYWTGHAMVYGDGGSYFEPLAGALDVAAHEFTHGVIERTVNLEYRLESGALNESFADIFAAMVDRDDWLMGEDIVTAKTSPALRDMETPENGNQPSHMDDFLDLEALNELYGNPLDTEPEGSNDMGGVHINSGIPNRACFLIAEQIGREKTEQIYYRILQARYLISKAQFVDMRLAAEQAAMDLFGESSAEVEAVQASFDAVGIVSEEATEASEEVSAPSGEEWIVMVNADQLDTSLLRATPDLGEKEVEWISQTQVGIATGNPFTVSADGHEVFFIDADNFIRAVNIDGTEEEVFSSTGEWSSLALSPDGTKLAATTVYEDTTIFIFDLEAPENLQEIRLYNPTTQADVQANVTRFADALDWHVDSRHLVYDSFNSLELGNDGTLGYWHINMLDTESEVIYPLFAGVPEGIHMANPSLAHTNESFMVFDFFDDLRGMNEVWVFDTFTGDAGFILETGPNFGFPSFSNDDRRLAFEFWDESQLNVHQISLKEGRLEANGANEYYLVEAQLPTWITISDDQQDSGTVVLETYEESLPATFSLNQNFPNPFNSRTVIEFDLPQGGHVTMEIFNLAGQIVATMIKDHRKAGHYQIRWDGKDDNGRALASGVYLYRLQFDGAHQATRKLVMLR